MYPSFLGIGAQRAATTWLHHSLRRHPDLWLPPAKELHYFDWISGGPSLVDRVTSGNRLCALWRQRVRGELRSSIRRGDFSGSAARCAYEFLAPSDSRYLGMFESAGQRIAGEITPAYSLLSDSEVKRVAALLPDARVIVMLRNPIGRAWSQVQLETGRPMSGRRRWTTSPRLIRSSAATTRRSWTDGWIIFPRSASSSVSRRGAHPSRRVGPGHRRIPRRRP